MKKKNDNTLSGFYLYSLLTLLIYFTDICLWFVYIAVYDYNEGAIHMHASYLFSNRYQCLTYTSLSKYYH